MTMLVIGECMMEFQTDNEGRLLHSFAGDTYNTAVYAKRIAKSSNIEFLSAVGSDQFSKDMLKAMNKQNVGTRFITQTDKFTIGLYAISTDESGERSFSYWRNDSAASHFYEMVDVDQFIQNLERDDNAIEWLYFSGISLAAIPEESKAKLLSLVEQLKSKGTKVAFDPNYRARLWQNLEHAVTWIQRAYKLADVLFPGLEDHEVLFGHKNHQDIAQFCEKLTNKQQELVVKCDEQGVFVYANSSDYSHVPFNPAPKQVDSTAAGDSFSGSYLGARINGEQAQTAAKIAASVARKVVQHRGAIIEQNVLDETD